MKVYIVQDSRSPKNGIILGGQWHPEGGGTGIDQICILDVKGRKILMHIDAIVLWDLFAEKSRSQGGTVMLFFHIENEDFIIAYLSSEGT